MVLEKYKVDTIKQSRDLESNYGVVINIMRLRDEPGLHAERRVRVMVRVQALLLCSVFTLQREEVRMESTQSESAGEEELLSHHLLESVFSELPSFVFSSSFISVEGRREVRPVLASFHCCHLSRH